MVSAGGDVTEDIITYLYSDDNLEGLPIYLVPHPSEENKTTLTIRPGTRFEGIAEWTVNSRVFVENAEQSEEDSMIIGFVKLRDGRGWVEMYHPITGGALLSRLS
jgi:hypothetical protein